jgi:hypothetical protein
MSPLFRRLGALTRSAERLVTFLQNAESAQFLFAGYASCAVVGWVVLCLPWNRPTRIADWLGQFCESVDDASTTGLVTVDTSEAASFPTELLANVLAGFRELGDTGAWQVRPTEAPGSPFSASPFHPPRIELPSVVRALALQTACSAGTRFRPVAGCRIARLRSF